MSGQTISHYRLVEKLGGGDMGVVYKAEEVVGEGISAPHETAELQAARTRKLGLVSNARPRLRRR